MMTFDVLYMRNRFYILFILCFFTLVTACATTDVEDYVDYFYANFDDAGNKGFTYILSVKGAQQTQEGKRNIALIEERKQQSSTRRKSSNPEDSNVPISFRMEEEAFARLDSIITKQNYCSGEVEYIKKEYTWLRYTITGICK